MNYFEVLVGDIVESTQGRDLGTRYLVVGIDKKGYCQLVNGKLRPIDKPKTKNSKHLSFVGRAPQILEKYNSKVTNCELHKLIEKFDQK